MTPLFAPKPAPPGISFGPGYGEQAQAQTGWGGAWNQGGGFGVGKDGGWPPSAWTGPAPAWPPATPPIMPTPQGYGWGSWGAQSPYGAMPGTGPFGQTFGGFDPYTRQQIAASGPGWPWGGSAR